MSCQLCTEYVKKLGCTALRCPWLAERIEAGVVGYREAVLETFPHERRLFQRLNLQMCIRDSGGLDHPERWRRGGRGDVRRLELLE